MKDTPRLNRGFATKVPDVSLGEILGTISKNRFLKNIVYAENDNSGIFLGGQHSNFGFFVCQESLFSNWGSEQMVARDDVCSY